MVMMRMMAMETANGYNCHFNGYSNGSESDDGDGGGSGGVVWILL